VPAPSKGVRPWVSGGAAWPLGASRTPCRPANGLLIGRPGLWRLATSLSGTCCREPGAQGRYGPFDAAGGHGWRDRSSPPSDTTTPTPDTLTDCVGFAHFWVMSCSEAHSGWREGCVTATPTPDTTEGVFGLVTGLWRSNECRPANGLLIRAGR
jgi:hypothetical protein